MHEVIARLQLAISAEFYRRGWMYQIPVPTDPEAPDSVALLTARREGLEEAARVAEADDSDPGSSTVAQIIAAAIRALIDQPPPEAP